MKRILFLIIVIVASMQVMGQTIRVDSRSGQEYAEIDSIPVSAISGCWATRMCLVVTSYNAQAVTFDWQVQYPWVVDSQTVDYYPLTKGTVTLPITDTSLSIGSAYRHIWQYAADSALVHGRFLINVNYK